MTQVIVAAAAVVVALVVATVLRRRQAPAAPTQPAYRAPVQLDRADFVASEPWLLVLFSSSTCAACADMKRKAQVLASHQVGVVEAEFNADRTLHAKYAVDAVPMVVVADQAGVVRASFIGPVTATDLWAAVAEVRQPGSTPSGVDGHCHRHDTAP